MLMLVLGLLLKDKGGNKQHCLIPFVCSNLGIETFLKKIEHQKRMHYNTGLRHLSILKAFSSFIPWLLNFSDLPNYGSNCRKRYTLRLLSKSLVRSILLPIGIKSPQYSDTLFDSRRWAPFSMVLHLCSS